VGIEALSKREKEITSKDENERTIIHRCSLSQRPDILLKALNGLQMIDPLERKRIVR